MTKFSGHERTGFPPFPVSSFTSKLTEKELFAVTTSIPFLIFPHPVKIGSFLCISIETELIVVTDDTNVPKPNSFLFLIFSLPGAF
jgi:hypothetical protein